METAPFLRGVLGLRFTQAVRGCAGARCCLRGPSGEIILILGEGGELQGIRMGETFMLLF